MIRDVRVIGEKEVAAVFDAAPGALRAALRDELAQVGDDIVSRARALAPKRSGVMASKITWYFGRERRAFNVGAGGKRRSYTEKVDRSAETGPIWFVARPGGSVAHLMERGVDAQRGPYFRREERVGTIWTRKGKKTIRRKGRTYVRPHAFRIAKRPFFTPAIEAVGGPSGVNARLQAAIDAVPPAIQGGA